MFGGGGFTGQMHETNKKNRELLKKNSHEPFERQYSKASEKKSLLVHKEMSEEERSIFLEELRVRNKQEAKKRLIVFIVSVIITTLVLYIFGAKVKESIMDFLN